MIPWLAADDPVRDAFAEELAAIRRRYTSTPPEPFPPEVRAEMERRFLEAQLAEIRRQSPCQR